jgi:hypothetical protein
MAFSITETDKVFRFVRWVGGKWALDPCSSATTSTTFYEVADRFVVVDRGKVAMEAYARTCRALNRELSSASPPPGTQ